MYLTRWFTIAFEFQIPTYNSIISKTPVRTIYLNRHSQEVISYYIVIIKILIRQRNYVGDRSLNPVKMIYTKAIYKIKIILREP